jgi:hypothetical protein
MLLSVLCGAEGYCFDVPTYWYIYIYVSFAVVCVEKKNENQNN